ncbi:glycosyltransferase family 4 protein [Paraburkholderia phymatum]|uniref:Glycosyl transferase group 1 n=1 Tax=Paraburkholderia phymatum (strain DSM 17167 / CIP 108236 / LMG 21445 / STM815) TaxID=391038 RepID=B2JFB3_PARP8|nr:glycosyltransferase family 4 protein [Paraburkholderia phymatum]ACC71481.1 glycosyl transferase group 1 [Paraburkholderia phymatum STM815]
MKTFKNLFQKSSQRIEQRIEDFKDFDPEAYLKLNPDVREAGVDPLLHYINHGRSEKRAFTFPPFECFENKAFDPARDTVLLVTHECSLTGAPVLVYNIAEVLSRSRNVVVLSLGPGMLEPLFKELDIAYVPAHHARFSRVHTEYIVEKIAKRFKLDFAIVNSIESQLVVTPLKQAGIPSVGLIHEFASCYPDPPARFKDMMTVPQQVVFSSEITYKDAVRFVDDFEREKIHILPQGRSSIPGKRVNDESAEKEQQRLRSILRPETEGARKYVVLGAGSVNFRKGVDLFLQCARQILSKVGEDQCRFVWIGQGYEPRKDAAYSVYLEDQIMRAGLTEAVEIIDETTEIETAYELSDLFLLSSRLDPLPNVAIDAMSFSKPLLCFDKTTGIVSFLEGAGLKELCIAAYLDVEDMADKASRLLLSADLRAQVASQLSAHVADSFDMERYVDHIVALVKPVAQMN